MRAIARNVGVSAAALLLLVGGGPIACGDDEGDDVDLTDPESFEELDISICDPGNGPFDIDIDNRFFPLAVGSEWELEGVDDEEDVELRIEMVVLDETEQVAGVTVRVVEVREFEDDELIEVARDFYAQAPDGTVCYFGEDVDDYEDGEIVGHEGQWRAGEGGNVPGILMPGAPRVGTKFFQEKAPNIAEDRSAIVGMNESVEVPAGQFEGCLLAVDWNPLEGDTAVDAEDKLYAPGVGLIVDDFAELVEYEID